jgi:DNA gyrase subunit A
MIITKSGMIIRSPVSQVRVAGRNTQGVKLVNLDNGDVVTAVARVVPDDDKEDEGDAGALGIDGGEGAADEEES